MNSGGTSIPIDTDQGSPIILELIYRLKIRDVMTQPTFTCTTDETMRDAQRIMKTNSISGIPVMEGRRLVGIVSVDDVITAMEKGNIEDPVQNHMTRQVIVLEDDMPLSFGISWLDKYRFGRLPVLNSKKELVGIVTSRDVIVALLLEINKEIERFEKNTKHKESSGEGFRLEYTTRPFDFEMAGRLSTETKQQLKSRDLPPKLIRRVAIATYELEMNQVVHSEGGTVQVSYEAKRHRVTIRARDHGPGIEDVEASLEEGVSTANEWVRSLGFGAGMGLPNTRRVSDEFSISSSPAGTNVDVVIYTSQEGKS
ncbi:histidine kinase [Alkalispirochaeta sphaeroplastigenens]|uniref:Histidine kinase n=1 Tax=Alkalispirochaeta sphaeroplastigenens TaxID=1187066 RepID=A0A2S4JZ23_9SPIO|nr:CBS domain-containing protein [Alkalispirochaeta sphaeroplastigenens]POR04764.1 histidine kinase [Alkalispirochaeta sphaeroplastigenens]